MSGQLLRSRDVIGKIALDLLLIVALCALLSFLDHLIGRVLNVGTKGGAVERIIYRMIVLAEGAIIFRFALNLAEGR